VRGSQSGEAAWAVTPQGGSLGLADQAQGAVSIGERHQGRGGPGQGYGLRAVEAVGGLLRLAHDGVGGHPVVAGPAGQSE
jgi:hypothetical protein